ncbi:ATP synthase subunit H, mitochondrial [Trichomonascus vanleenenianus]|uniref:F1F0 ATP synthase subunit h n=1 Tax=Trichomonascus vanleenenianus TaxID=2268995 RepID=UPI003EC9CFDB
MFARTVARRVPTLARSIQTTAIKRDLVKDLYLKELKAFKPTPRTAADAQGEVRQWNVPQAPQAPKLEAAEADALAQYEAQEVEVETAIPEGEDAPAASMEEWFVVEDQFAETKAHH